MRTLTFPQRLAFGLSLLGLSMQAQAGWWIEADDLALRSDIQLLADIGIIKQPVTTFPLMWQAVISDVQAADPQQLNPQQAEVLRRVVAAYMRDKRPSQARISLAGETEQPQFVRFGDTLRDEAQLGLQYSYHSDNLSGRLQVSRVHAPVDGQRTRLDGSYVAVKAWNWVVSVGALEKYWGPSWDASTIVSTNARPVAGISFSRHSSAAKADDWLPAWTFTTSFGQLSERAAVPSAKLWQARLGTKPLDSLELGFSWVMQYGGDGYGNGLNDWFNALFDGGTLEGTENMLAGYDARWSGSVLDKPLGVYFSATAEDFNSKKLALYKVVYQLGADVFLSSIDSRIYAEFVDTTIDCSDDRDWNCMYEHSVHQDGYRRYGRNFGSPYDNDSRAFNLGVLTQLDINTHWHNKIAALQLNIDGGRVDLPSQWTQTQLPARNVLLWRTEQQWREDSDQVKWGLEFSRTTYKASNSSDWQTELFLQWQRLF